MKEKIKCMYDLFLHFLLDLFSISAHFHKPLQPHIVKNLVETLLFHRDPDLNCDSDYYGMQQGIWGTCDRSARARARVTVWDEKLCAASTGQT